MGSKTARCLGAVEAASVASFTPSWRQWAVGSKAGEVKDAAGGERGMFAV